MLFQPSIDNNSTKFFTTHLSDLKTVGSSPEILDFLLILVNDKNTNINLNV